MPANPSSCRLYATWPSPQKVADSFPKGFAKRPPCFTTARSVLNLNYPILCIFNLLIQFNHCGGNNWSATTGALVLHCRWPLEAGDGVTRFFRSLLAHTRRDRKVCAARMCDECACALLHASSCFLTGQVRCWQRENEHQ